LVIVGVAIAILLGLSLFCYYTGNSDPTARHDDRTRNEPQAGQHEEPAGIGQRLSELALEPLTGDGKPVTLDAVGGKVVVVNFWGTWCGPCRQEFPELMQLYDKFRDDPGFRFLSVSCGNRAKEDLEDLRAATESFLKAFRYQIPTYSDPDAVTRKAFHRLAGFQGYPTTVVLDREGTIRRIWLGSEPGIGEQIAGVVDGLLKLDEPKSRK
jgi:cytochrome c biogenesis protein CcmG, thiol:disulfide interchange protein DsbE